ncbi:MAG: hypothetical protein F4X18_13425 [Acidimicrobiia bacterium]|nr:hypothetical protein [Acidimicrobiia bacterium]MYC86485.1 hypothetical protein [Acidimicrobiia bacterium]
MKGTKVVMVILASLHLAWSAVIALVANFADGGSGLERLLLGAVHPLAALLLLYAVVSSARPSLLIRRVTLAMLSVSICGDILVAVLIGQGTLRGDWPLPLTFAVVPVIGLVYLTRRGYTGQLTDG